MARFPRKPLTAEQLKQREMKKAMREAKRAPQKRVTHKQLQNLADAFELRLMGYQKVNDTLSSRVYALSQKLDDFQRSKGQQIETDPKEYARQLYRWMENAQVSFPEMAGKLNKSESWLRSQWEIGKLLKEQDIKDAQPVQPVRHASPRPDLKDAQLFMIRSIMRQDRARLIEHNNMLKTSQIPDMVKVSRREQEAKMTDIILEIERTLENRGKEVQPRG